MTVISPTTIAELERLAAEATPGPWEAEYEFESSKETTQWYCHLASDGQAHTNLFDTAMSDVKRIRVEEDEDEEGRVTYWDDQGEANMNLIAALRNALPDLLAAAKFGVRARAIVDAAADWAGCGGNFDETPHCFLFDKLMAAGFIDQDGTRVES
ncbi:MAG TPA: hypothetical protein VFR23_24470 [Jiangellaceae bacterium]|nr:hypothetical protein [Jiangellaceae bacterium]